MTKFRSVLSASVVLGLLSSPALAQYQQQGGYGQPAYGQPAYNQPAPQRSAGPLSSIFSCQAQGNRQSTGAILGALAGGAIGNRVADNERGLGTVLGAAIGAAAGSYIGCRMQVADQQRAQSNAQIALDQGRSQYWTDPQTGNTGRTDIVNTFYGQAPVQQRPTPESIAYPQGIERPREYQPSEGVYTASGAVNIRSGPSARSNVVGSLRAGDRVDGLVRVEGTPWVLAVRNGAAVGYVSETNMRFAGQASQQAAQGPMCRTFDQTFQPRSGSPETQRYTACRGPQGDWIIQA